ncbi:hypothetical protein DFO45_2304 [Azorhizobium sp. AG788]|uniref:DUF6950 family protein n=1 Tax=Azorhizobium sp. AG788 TaxID=2183897 RepID=UPI00105D4A8B|nr:hypothetical protein [Azorhizobium sp. AG788]TDT94554.1 hypothetical protein DFO45_2304 [Azorhizobium sp. AG788]
MNRLPDWHDGLAAVIARHDALPFEWGTSDCLSFPADVVEAITGASVDRPAYRSQRGALRALRRLGAADPHEALAQRFTEIPPAFAATGDLAAIIGDDGAKSGGVVVGALIYVKAPQGLGRLPRIRMVRAFKV